jgi:hypothetical protein
MTNHAAKAFLYGKVFGTFEKDTACDGILGIAE